MQHQLEQVAKFHRQIGAPIAEGPRLLETDREMTRQLSIQLRSLIHSEHERRKIAIEDPLFKRTAMAIEELAEWLEAHVCGDLNAAADAWADRCYILFGDAIATGMPAADLFESVHFSNMSKRGRNPETGKAIKATDYLPPGISIEEMGYGSAISTEAERQKRVSKRDTK